LLTDLDLQDILALNLSRAVQLSVDMGAHIVAQLEVPAPGTMGQTFDLLADQGVLTRELAQQLKKAVGFRNIAVHNYDAINWLMVHSITRDHLSDFSLRQGGGDVDGLALKLKPMPTAIHTQALYAVYGASGYGREVLPLAREQLVRAGVSATQLVLVDDQPGPPEVNGQRLLSYAQFLAEPAAARHAVLAIASGKVREALAKRLSADGVQPWSVAAANVVQMDDVQLGAGAVLSPFVTITSNVRIGQHFHANLYSYVAHDCVVGDFVTFAPGVHCNGNVVIEDHAYIGTGAILKQGQPGKPLVIGRGAVVGMGAVVTKSVAPGVTVVGNPARPLVR
jgi:sugar O-acyltransferase (sialic acid O-acetyltransferase NeuD family)